MSYFVYVSNNHCHRVTIQLQLINIFITYEIQKKMGQRHINAEDINKKQTRKKNGTWNIKSVRLCQFMRPPTLPCMDTTGCRVNSEGKNHPLVDCTYMAVTGMGKTGVYTSSVPLYIAARHLTVVPASNYNFGDHHNFFFFLKARLLLC